jgi:hypothetical protein
MNIEHYDYIYPVVHDLSTVRSSTFSKINYEEVSLLNTTRGKLVPRDLFGVFIDERNNIFLGLSTIFKTYNLILNYNSNKYNINYTFYENVADIVSKPANSSAGFFKFMDSKPARRYSEERCDVDRNGPVVFIRDGQTPHSGNAFNSLVSPSLSDIEVYSPILSVDSIGHLIYIKYYDKPNPNLEEFPVNENDLPTVARSIFPTLKVLIEWAEMTKEPWNSNEPVALAVEKFLAKIGMPEEVKNEIEENQSDMHVYRYLRGETNARRQPPVEELSEMKPLTKTWLKTKFLYQNVTVFYRALAG